MQLLDVSLAFALTMAALATVVTIIMEAGLRLSRMRKKNFIEVMKLLNKELENSPLEMSEEERWKFFKQVIDNPAEASIERLTSELKNLSLDEKLAYFGRDKANGKNPLQRLGGFIMQIFGDKKRTGIFAGVSLEYMLRCLAETETVINASSQASSSLKTEFNRLARKYEEFNSAVSASFKQHAQQWSLVVGIFLAIVANVDALRIYQAYRLDPELAVAIIEKTDTLLEKNQAAQASIDELTGLYIQKKELAKQIDKAKEDKDDMLAQLIEEKAEIEKKISQQSEIEQIQKTVQNAKQQVTDLIDLGVPIGWDYYPNCPYNKEGTDPKWETSGARCKDITERQSAAKSFVSRALLTAKNDPSGFAIWLITVVITGVFIGLGAPFWFDIAKRLAQVRKGFQTTAASAEYRFSARDANGDPEKRREIVATVLEDTLDIAKSKTNVGETGTIPPA